jgi:hypothetical protein
MGVGERDLFQPVGVVGGRSAFEVDGAVGQQRDTGRRRHRIELDRELVELELRLHSADDRQADIDRKADRFLVVVQIGERDRRVAVADGDGAGFLDFLQRPRQLFGVGLRGAECGGDHEADHTQMFHSSLPAWITAIMHKSGRSRT